MFIRNGVVCQGRGGRVDRSLSEIFLKKKKFEKESTEQQYFNAHIDAMILDKAADESWIRAG